jgi:hypothetical protein
MSICGFRWDRQAYPGIVINEGCSLSNGHRGDHITAPAIFGRHRCPRRPITLRKPQKQPTTAPCSHVWGYFHAANEKRCINCGEIE